MTSVQGDEEGRGKRRGWRGQGVDDFLEKGRRRGALDQGGEQAGAVAGDDQAGGVLDRVTALSHASQIAPLLQADLIIGECPESSCPTGPRAALSLLSATSEAWH